MPLPVETLRVPTAGYTGYFPQKKYQVGQTYGNGTREILNTDTNLKSGKHQQEETAKRRELFAKKMLEQQQLFGTASNGEEKKLAKRGLSGAEDRANNHPIAGYTGYVPCSIEHCGKPFTVALVDSLQEFESINAAQDAIPPRLQAIKTLQTHLDLSQTPAKPVPESALLPESKSKQQLANANTSPYKLPKGHPDKKFVRGYTGFVPHMNENYGASYAKLVQESIDSFTEQVSAQPNLYTNKDQPLSPVIQHTRTPVRPEKPIAGYTGFIPTSRYAVGYNYSKLTTECYGRFNRRDEKGRLPPSEEDTIPKKELVKDTPIPGYLGYIPGYGYTSERGFPELVKECYVKFNNARQH